MSSSQDHSHASLQNDSTSLAVHAVVPVKELAHAKSRLSPHLSPAKRQKLALDMLCKVLDVLRATREQPDSSHAWLQTVWIISRDPEVLQLATHYGARTLHDYSKGLNQALRLAQDTVTQAGAEALLVVPADVPLITCADIASLVTALRTSGVLVVPEFRPPACVIAPNQHASGTNALGVTLPSCLPFQFGTGSFSRHLKAAYQMGMRVQVYISSTLALDIDTPDDLARAQQSRHQQECPFLDRSCRACL